MSPRLTPIRTASFSSARRFRRFDACCICAAHESDCAAPSTRPSGRSPRDLTSRPPVRSSAPRSSAKCSRPPGSSAATDRGAGPIAVEPSSSVIQHGADLVRSACSPNNHACHPDAGATTPTANPLEFSSIPPPPLSLQRLFLLPSNLQARVELTDAKTNHRGRGRASDQGPPVANEVTL